MNDSNLKYQIIYDIVSAEDNILSNRARSTFNILPLKGKIA